MYSRQSQCFRNRYKVAPPLGRWKSSGRTVLTTDACQEAGSSIKTTASVSVSVSVSN